MPYIDMAPKICDYQKYLTLCKYALDLNIFQKMLTIRENKLLNYESNEHSKKN